VTYLVFSNSRDLPASQPNYVTWRERCAELLEEVGGLGDGYELFEWEDLLAPEEIEVDEIVEAETEGADEEVQDSSDVETTEAPSQN
jgi:hypothetical protein